MKFTILPLLLVSVLASAQKVTPTSFDFGSITVGQTSPQARMTFQNTGQSDLTLTVSITGPFAIPVNQCGRGVKARTHCDVYITYTPEVPETDTGALMFNYGQGESSISLSGTGVNGQSLQPTITDMPPGARNPHGTINPGNVQFYVGVKTTKYESIPDGETVYVTCEGSTGGTVVGSGQLYTDTAHPQLVIDQAGEWTCKANYPGDSQFGPSASRWKLKFDVR